MISMIPPNRFKCFLWGGITTSIHFPRLAWLAAALCMSLGLLRPAPAADVTEEGVLDALLGRVRNVPEEFDVNRDGKVDAADLMRLARLGPVLAFSTKTSLATMAGNANRNRLFLAQLVNVAVRPCQ